MSTPDVSSWEPITLFSVMHIAHQRSINRFVTRQKLRVLWNGQNGSTVTMTLKITSVSMKDYSNLPSFHCAPILSISLRDLYARENLTPGKGNGYFQRFTEVIDDLKKIGAPLDEHQNDLKNLTLAFAIRHVSIHNFGYADEGFVKSTGTELKVGEHAPVNQEIYLKCSDSYREFLRCMDRWLTLRSGGTAKKRAAP